MKYSGYNTGEMAELAEGARLLSECSLKRATEGSNPSLSAIFMHSPTAPNTPQSSKTRTSLHNYPLQKKGHCEPFGYAQSLPRA